jgi:23S rRNA (adenine1618-N6)-methyltransferase
MPVSPKKITEEKDQLHPRNRHRQRYNFPELITACPELSAYVSLNQFQDLSIDFKNPLAVKVLNKALLKHFYSIEHWDIPEGYLCPPIPGRADYMHYIADLLVGDNAGEIPRGKRIKVLDIGTGANCIYPLIGNYDYGWSFVGSDIDDRAVKSAKNIIAVNDLSKAISIRKQNSTQNIFSGVINTAERFALTMCNPPFHSSMEDAMTGTERKWKNLGHADKAQPTLNFGGKNAELWCEGGEERFVRRMISESVGFAKQCLWFTTLISKKETLASCYHALEKAGAIEVKTISMAQGQKVSRVLAWTFLNQDERFTFLSKQ